jgi:hypothetical protein
MLSYCISDKTLLHDIALKNDAEAMCILLNTTRGRLWIAENINVKDRKSGATPLLLAIAGLRGSTDSSEFAGCMFQRSLHKGVCLPEACTSSFCAMDLVDKPHVEIVEMLLSVGADPAIADKDGFNAIHYWMMAAASLLSESHPPDHTQAVLDLLPNYFYRVEASSSARTSVPALLKFLRSPRVTKVWRQTVATNKLIDDAITARRINNNNKRSLTVFLFGPSSSSTKTLDNDNNDVYANVLEQTKRPRIAY